MAFNETNYRRLRAETLNHPRFDWAMPYQMSPSDSGCLACLALRLEGNTGEVNDSKPVDLERFLGCCLADAHALYWCEVEKFGLSDEYNESDPGNRAAAVAALDQVAARYGVTPDPQPAPFTGNPDQFLAELRDMARELVSQ